MTRLDQLRPTRPPDAARRSGRGIDAVTILTIYLVLLLAVPSSLTLTAVGSIGKPATIWALGATLWWAASRVQRFVPSRFVAVALHVFLFAFLGVVMVGYAVAMLRGLPANEVSAADAGVLRLLGWVGIALVASDGIDDPERFRVLLRRIAWGGALMAVLGLLQFLTNQSLLNWISIPGFSSDGSNIVGVDSREGFLRASGTAAHPLEYATVLCVALPLTISFAIDDVTRSRVLRWIPVFVIGAAAILAVSRSALVGLAAGVFVLIPGWTRAVRWVFATVAVVFAVAIAVLVPGIAGTLRGLFLGIGGDTSTVSRVDSFDGVAEFVRRFPVVGKGFGTFLPTYHILDDEYLLLVVEAGVLGLAVFVALLVSALWSAGRSRRVLRAHPLDRSLAQALMASTVSGAVLLAFFDSFSFPMSAGILFLIIGLCGGSLRLAYRRSHLEVS